jgi:hypothetical protein
MRTDAFEQTDLGSSTLGTESESRKTSGESVHTGDAGFSSTPMAA